MKQTIEVHRFEHGNQGKHYMVGTIERALRYTTFRGAGGCVTEMWEQKNVPFVFIGKTRFRVIPGYGRANWSSDVPTSIYLSSDFVIPKSVDKLITKVEKVLR